MIINGLRKFFSARFFLQPFSSFKGITDRRAQKRCPGRIGDSGMEEMV